MFNEPGFHLRDAVLHHIHVHLSLSPEADERRGGMVFDFDRTDALTGFTYSRSPSGPGETP